MLLFKPADNRGSGSSPRRFAPKTTGFTSEATTGINPESLKT